MIYDRLPDPWLSQATAVPLERVIELSEKRTLLAPVKRSHPLPAVVYWYPQHFVGLFMHAIKHSEELVTVIPDRSEIEVCGVPPVLLLFGFSEVMIVSPVVDAHGAQVVY